MNGYAKLSVNIFKEESRPLVKIQAALFLLKSYVQVSDPPITFFTADFFQFVVTCPAERMPDLGAGFVEMIASFRFV